MRCRTTDDAQVVCFVKYVYELCFYTQLVLLVAAPFHQADNTGCVKDRLKTRFKIFFLEKR